MAEQEISQKTALLSERLTQRLGASGPTLAAQVQKAGRALPRRLRKEAQYVATAEQMAHHPKLRNLIDEQQLNRATRHLATYLKSIDPVERRKTMLLGIAGSVAFSLLATFALLVAVLHWRGFL